MYNAHPGLRLVAVGIVLTLLDLRLNAFDFVPDWLGYGVIAFGLGRHSPRNARFNVAYPVACVLAVIALASILAPVPTPPRAVPNLPGLPFPASNDVFRVNWSWTGAVTSVLETMMFWLICDGVRLFSTARGDAEGAQTAASRRDQYVVLSVLSLVSMVLVASSSGPGFFGLFGVALCSFVVNIALARLLWRVANARSDEQVLAHLVAPTPIHTLSIMEHIRQLPAFNQVLLNVALFSVPVVTWLLIEPCSWLDTTLRKSGCVAIFDEHTGYTTGVTAHPNEQFIVTNSGGSVKQIDIFSGRTLYERTVEPSEAFGVAVSPDGSTIAMVQNNQINVYRDWTLVAAVPVEIAMPEHIVFSPDSLSFAAADRNGRVHIWQSANGNQIHVLVGVDTRIEAIQYTSEGTLIAVSQSQIAEWRVADGTLLRVTELPNVVTNVTTAPGAKYFATVNDGAIEIRTVLTGAVVRTFEQHIGDKYVRLAFSHDGSMFTLHKDSERAIIELWRTNDGSRIGVLPIPEDGGSWGFRTMSFTSDDRYVVSSGISVGPGRNNVALWRVP